MPLHNELNKNMWLSILKYKKGVSTFSVINNQSNPLMNMRNNFSVEDYDTLWKEINVYVLKKA